jgi:hypothetical protein
MSKKNAGKDTDIPTLTEVVATVSLPDARANSPAAAAEPEAPASEAAAKAIERLIYKVLYRHLPQLSQEISAEILQSLQKQPARKKSKK